jgi:SWI/SNF-related matrix-associated actin-dependent regulator 1 of chromatin subfamily A
VVDVPKFVDTFLTSKTPFETQSKLKRLMDYDGDLKNKKTIEMLPEAMLKVMFNFQKEGVKFGISKFGRLLLGDEMGVGKTIQALGIAYVFKNDWPLLIIVPASLKF